MSPVYWADGGDGGEFQTLEMNFSAGDKDSFQKERNKEGNILEGLTGTFQRPTTWRQRRQTGDRRVVFLVQKPADEVRPSFLVSLIPAFLGAFFLIRPTLPNDTPFRSKDCR